jgi:hypothetical protein
MVDYSQIPTEDLIAMKEGRIQDVSTPSLLAFKGERKGLKQGVTGDAGGAARAGIYSFLDQYALNKPTSAIGAGIAKIASPITGDERTFKELYTQALADTAATEQASPMASAIGTGLGIASQLLTPLGAEKALAQGVTKGATLSKIGKFASNRLSKGTLAKGIEGMGRRGIVAAPVAGAFGADIAPQGQELEGFGKGAAYGAGIAAAAPVVLGGIGAGVKATLPKVDEAMQEVGRLAQKYEIPLSMEQISKSKALQNIQKVSSQLPLSGELAFRDKQMQSWNKALFKTIGMEADKFTPMNIDKAFINVGKEFDNLGKGKTFQLDDDFARSIDEIKQEAESIYSKDAINNFDNTVTKLFSEADNQGIIGGEKLNSFRSKVNELSRKSKNIETKELLHDLENSIIEKMTNYSPEVAEQFSKTKQKYKNLLVLEPLAAKAKGGNISPALLGNRVSKIYGRSFVRGKAGEIGDLARVGSELLPELGGSDTVQKGLYATGLISGAVNPALIPEIVTGLSANRAYQSFINRNQSLVNKMLQGRNVSKEVMKLSPAEAKIGLSISNEINKLKGAK